jgi:hypothetical protein
MKEFKEYLSLGIVKKQTSNKERAISIVNEAEKKKEFLEISLKEIPTGLMNTNFIVDYSYDILMELIRAEMYLIGYNVGNSHEAEVSYLKILKFSEPDIRFMDELRYYRNGTKYYGTIISNEYAKKVLEKYKTIYARLKRIVSNDIQK